MDPQQPSRPFIGFLTDFGLDGAAATCRAVMIGICPDVQIVDIAHTLRKYAIRDGSFLMAAALPFAPVGVHVGVVDPGVGTERRAIGIQTGRGDVLIGPDNGLLPPVADALGGAIEARELTNRTLWLPSPSATFHGRDIFSPVAAHLVAGHAPFDAVGPPIPLDDVTRLPRPVVAVADGILRTQVIYVDTFGNLRLAGGRRELEQLMGPEETGGSLEVRIGSSPAARAAVAPSFGHVEAGELIVYVDSSSNLAVALNRDSLAAATGADTGTEVSLRRA